VLSGADLDEDLAAQSDEALMSRVQEGDRGAYEELYARWKDPGSLFWVDYRLDVSLRSSDNDGIGVIFRYQNPNNYYKFDMDSQSIPATQTNFASACPLSSKRVLAPGAFFPRSLSRYFFASDGDDARASLAAASALTCSSKQRSARLTFPSVKWINPS